eukprot:EG_transcript_59108
MPKTMYQNDGSGRDLYVNKPISQPSSGLGGARLDRMPANVRSYLQDQVTREQYQAYTSSLTRVQNVNLPWEEGKGLACPKLVQAELLAEGRFLPLEQKAARRERLKALYDR